MILWMGVKHQDKRALELFTREIAPAGTGMGEERSYRYLALWTEVLHLVHSHSTQLPVRPLSLEGGPKCE